MTTHNRNEELVLAHFEAHATDEQKQAVKAAGKTPAGAMAYAYEQARALPRTGSCVAVDDATVFAWTMRYFTDAAIPADPDRSPAVQPNPPAEVKEPPAAKTRKPGTEKPDADVEVFSRKILRRVREAYRTEREGSVKRG